MSAAAAIVPMAAAAPPSGRKPPPETLHTNVLGRDADDQESRKPAAKRPPKKKKCASQPGEGAAAREPPRASEGRGGARGGSEDEPISEPPRSPGSRRAMDAGSRRRHPTTPEDAPQHASLESPPVGDVTDAARDDARDAAGLPALPAGSTDAERRHWWNALRKNKKPPEKRDKRLGWGSGKYKSVLAPDPAETAVAEPSVRHPLQRSPAPSPEAARARKLRMPAADEDSYGSYKRMNSGDTPLANAGRAGRRYNYRKHSTPSCVHRSFRLDGPDGELFATRHDQLNQGTYFGGVDDLSLQEDHGEDQDDTAFMAAAAMTFPDTTSRNVVSAENSTLFYNYNGRLLMTLPCDRVRLVVDDDLPSGILAVEQCRKDPSRTDAADIELQKTRLTASSDQGLDAPAPLESQKIAQDKEQALRYVQVVPGDLYQRVVSEMSESLTDTYCGIFRCCDESAGHVDITVALAILGVFFFFLIIFTLVWPTT